MGYLGRLRLGHRQLQAGAPRARHPGVLLRWPRELNFFLKNKTTARCLKVVTSRLIISLFHFALYLHPADGTIVLLQASDKWTDRKYDM
jgi:hypothetical protein